MVVGMVCVCIRHARVRHERVRHKRIPHSARVIKGLYMALCLSPPHMIDNPPYLTPPTAWLQRGARLENQHFGCSGGRRARRTRDQAQLGGASATVLYFCVYCNVFMD
jgi:hypothetical protein